MPFDPSTATLFAPAPAFDPSTARLFDPGSAREIQEPAREPSQRNAYKSLPPALTDTPENAPAPPKPAAEPIPDLAGANIEGAPVPADSAVGRIATSALEGARAGWGEGLPGMSAKDEAGMRKLGVFPDPETGRTGPLRQINEAVVKPLWTAGDAAIRAGTAGFGAAQGAVSQAISELPSAKIDGATSGGVGGYLREGAASLLNSNLAGRDVAAQPESMMGMPEALRMPHPPGSGAAIAADVAQARQTAAEARAARSPTPTLDRMAAETQQPGAEPFVTPEARARQEAEQPGQAAPAPNQQSVVRVYDTAGQAQNVVNAADLQGVTVQPHPEGGFWLVNQDGTPHVTEQTTRTGGQAPPPAPQATPPVETPEAVAAAPPGHTNTPSGAYVMVPPDQLRVDPQRFQFKQSDENGVTGALHGVTRWEPSLANPITAWQDADGQLWVVNGHQRHDLATRAQAAGQTGIEMPARVFREEDGYTPEFMRTLGAYQNMAEGSGTAVDAAKIIRGATSLPPDMTLPDLPPRSQVVAQGRALAALSDEAFGVVANGVVEPAFAAHVGAMIRDPKEQMAALDVLARAHPATSEQARLMVQDIRDSGFLQSAQTSLFGDEAFAQSLVPERARILENAMRKLRQAKGIFRTAVEGEDTLSAAGNQLDRDSNIRAKSDNERILDTLQRNATTRGPLSDALSAAARDLAGGKQIAGVTSQFLTETRRLVGRGEAEGLQHGVVPGGVEHEAAGEPGAVEPPAAEPPVEGQGGLFGEAPGEAAKPDEPAPTTDLLGQPERAASAPRTPEPTIHNDPAQITMPGMEPSAHQAQAARDAAGPKGGQLPANEGLFAPKEAEQPGLPGHLYAGPGAIFDPAAWKFMVGPLVKPAKAAVAAVGELAKSIANGLVPMRNGSVRAQKFAADFANGLRQVQYRFGMVDRELERSFTPAEREAMGRAMDAQSVFEQQVRKLAPDQQDAARAAFDAAGTGLAGLTDRQRKPLYALDQLSRHAWSEMQKRGMVDPQAEGLPFYFPRQMIRWSEENGFTRASGQGGTGGGLDQRGKNLTTAGPMRREHLTPEETEAAAQAVLGADTSLLRDIRSLPARLAFSHQAMAGVDLMNQIKHVGDVTGVNTVLHGDIPGLLKPGDYFTIADHPAFRRFVGSGWQAVHVAREFEGPLRAVLSQASPLWYKAAMAIKGGVMSAIMFSPFIHLAVELGRALPVMPGRILTLQALRDGSRLRADLDYMDGATRDGLAPLGRGWAADPVSIADQANVEGRNRFIRALAGARDAAASAAGKVGGQFAHDVIQHPHQTLLWDQVFNLQVGIYDTMRGKYIQQGYAPEVAGTMAAHIANRYAGALPAEHLSRGANMAANLLLFSRSFTLGNLGVIKDTMTGAPSHVLSRIESMAGPEVAKSAQSALRRKALSAFVLDIGLFYVANGLLQAGLQVLRQTPQVGLPAAAQHTYEDWLSGAELGIQGAMHGNPLDLFGVLPQHWNEPGKQDRVYAGTDANGRGVYLRLPPGKVGEEFLGWFSKPGTMLENKASPLVRPIIELIMGHDSLGRALLPPNPHTIGDYIDSAGAIVKHIASNLGPVQTIEGLHEMWQQHVQGKATQADPYVSAAKVFGPLTGLAQVSSGYPGGPAAGEMHAESEREKFVAQQAMPDIRQKIAAGDIDGAVADMSKLNISPGLQRYYLQQALQPGPTAAAVRRLGAAPPDIQARVARQGIVQP